MSDVNIDVLARTIFGEARGEGLPGQEAVASVILNRVAMSQKKGGYWWGNTIAEVCQKSQQFSCWNANDPNFAQLHVVNENNSVFAICKRIAQRAISGFLEDKTEGATHYHTKKVRPKWSIGKIPCAEIGRHIFYNDIERGS